MEFVSVDLEKCLVAINKHSIGKAIDSHSVEARLECGAITLFAHLKRSLGVCQALFRRFTGVDVLNHGDVMKRQSRGIALHRSGYSYPGQTAVLTDVALLPSRLASLCATDFVQRQEALGQILRGCDLLK